MKIIFFGSDDFAAAHLEELLRQKFQIVACVTQPDRPKGRGMKIEMSSIKSLAFKHNIPLLQPEDIKDAQLIKELEKFSPDLFVVIAYGRILTSKILSIPKLFAVNVHGSLLPKYRGAAPINWAIINGEKETGITLIKLNTQMDAGDIIGHKKIAIEPQDDAVILRKKLIEIGKNHLVETLHLIENGKVEFKQQDLNQVSLAPKLTKELGRIDWTKDAQEIHQLIRGLIPWPTAYTSIEGKALKILSAEVVEGLSFSPGKISKIQKEGVVVCTGKKSLLIKDVQPESSKRMTAHEFAIGHHLKEGQSFNA